MVSISHKLLALGLAALLLVQYAPVVELIDLGEHNEACTYCNGSFCLRHAKGDNGSQDEHQPMAADYQQTSHHRTAQESMRLAEPHTHHADEKLQFCTCNHGHPQALATIVVDEVVFSTPDGVEWPFALQTLLAAPVTLPKALFAAGLFHPPRA
jgi:hypothetical protein